MKITYSCASLISPVIADRPMYGFSGREISFKFSVTAKQSLHLPLPTVAAAFFTFGVLWPRTPLYRSYCKISHQIRVGLSRCCRQNCFHNQPISSYGGVTATFRTLGRFPKCSSYFSVYACLHLGPHTPQCPGPPLHRSTAPLGEQLPATVGSPLAVLLVSHTTCTEIVDTSTTRRKSRLLQCLHISGRVSLLM